MTLLSIGGLPINQFVGRIPRRSIGRFPMPRRCCCGFQPLAAIPLWPAYFLWIALSSVALALACRPYLSWGGIGLVFISQPLVRGLCTGQVSAALAALMIWACGTKNRIAAGVAFGIIASVKPQLVVMAPLLFIFTRDWKAMCSAGGTLIATVVATLIIFGADRWPEWFASLDNFHRIVAGTNISTASTSPYAAAEHFGLNPLPFLFIGAALGILIVHQCRSQPPLEKAASIAVGSIAAAPYALTYDLAPVVPFLVWAIMRGRIWPVIALMGKYHPLPLAISAFELLWRTSLPHISALSKRNKVQT